MRDAAFRPSNGIGANLSPSSGRTVSPKPLPESALPLELPYVEEIRPRSRRRRTAVQCARVDGPTPRDQPPWPGVCRQQLVFPSLYGLAQRRELLLPGRLRLLGARWTSTSGGTEHAVGHLLYSRMWTKFLFDRDYIGHDETVQTAHQPGHDPGKQPFRLPPGTEGFPTTWRNWRENKPVFVSGGIAGNPGAPRNSMS